MIKTTVIKGQSPSSLKEGSLRIDNYGKYVKLKIDIPVGKKGKPSTRSLVIKKDELLKALNL